MNTSEFKRAAVLLSELGITCNYAGFNIVAYALSLSLQEPERLMLVGKWLYPDVAKKFNTSTACIVRNIRTICDVAWKSNFTLLCKISKNNLTKKPTNAKFLALATNYLSAN